LEAVPEFCGWFAAVDVVVIKVLDVVGRAVVVG
jgi:hypothetical protein